ncbi:MAG TPA: hypothetical protein VFU13_22780 [Steroidobacteraceae bacterium]|nr:hypothetical protein [Steroidobacteraceae bacterium]
MRPRRFLISALLSASLVLAPLSSAHAHIDLDHMPTHAGHAHDAEHANAGVDPSSVVELGKFANAGPLKFSWTAFVAVFFMAILFAIAPVVLQVVRPRRRKTEPIPRRPCIPPPLRGPPAFSI